MAFSGDFQGPAADPSPLQPETPEAPSAGEVAPNPSTVVLDPSQAAATEPAASEVRAAEPEPVEPTPTVQDPAGPAPTPATGQPQLAAIIEIPATGAPEDADTPGGGEWELLVSQLSEWLTNLKLQQTFQELRRPLTLLGWLLALLLVLRIYGAVIGTIDHLPLVPGLLELVGVIAVGRFAATRLVRSQERQTLIRQLGDRWKAFLG